MTRDTAASVEPDQPSAQQEPRLRGISESSRRKLARLTGTSAVLTASLAALAIGIIIGNAARKRIDRVAHGYS